MTLTVLAICLTGLSLTIQSLCFYRDQTSAVLNRTSSDLVISEQEPASEDQARMWAVTGIAVTPAEDLVDIDMLDPNHGKALGEKGTIFETADGGKSWQQLGGGPQTSHFVRISFTNTSIGWAVSWKSRSSSNNALVPEYDALLIQTKDGGRNWTVQYTIKNGSLNQVRFVDEHEGWAVGSTRQTAGDGESERMLILHTVDQGQHWRDISRTFGKAEFSDSAEDIVSNGASKAAILTDRGTIFSTDDGGRTWSSKKAAKSERPQFVNLRIQADEEDRLWVLSSANSREVIGARLARTDRNSR